MTFEILSSRDLPPITPPMSGEQAQLVQELQGWLRTDPLYFQRQAEYDRAFQVLRLGAIYDVFHGYYPGTVMEDVKALLGFLIEFYLRFTNAEIARGTYNPSIMDLRLRQIATIGTMFGYILRAAETNPGTWPQI